MTFSFTLKGTFNAEQQTALTDKLIEAGCDYPEVSAHNDIITLEFFPDASEQDLQQVIQDEIKRVESTGVLVETDT